MCSADLKLTDKDKIMSKEKKLENTDKALHIGGVTLSLREQLIERYSTLLTKNHKYQMGDDDYALTTEELRICRPLNVILQDLKN